MAWNKHHLFPMPGGIFGKAMICHHHCMVSTNHSVPPMETMSQWQQLSNNLGKTFSSRRRRRIWCNRSPAHTALEESPKVKRRKPNDSAPILNPTALAEFSTSHQLSSTCHQSATAAAIVYSLGAQQSGSSGFAVPPVFLFTEGYQPWNYHRVLSQEPPVKS